MTARESVFVVCGNERELFDILRDIAEPKTIEEFVPDEK